MLITFVVFGKSTNKLSYSKSKDKVKTLQYNYLQTCLVGALVDSKDYWELCTFLSVLTSCYLRLLPDLGFAVV